MSSELLLEREGNTLVMTISDPASRNTLSEPLLSAGVEALATAESDPGVRCLVLRGAGAHFCAGGNVQGLQTRRRSGPAAQAHMLDQLHGFVEALRACPKPVIAAVEGAAAGAGFSLALACDLIVAAEDARFIVSHARLGLSPDGGVTAALSQALPRQLAQQWVWLAEPVDARELHQRGLVNWLSASGGALAQALSIAARLAEMAPNAIASGKELVREGRGRDLGTQLGAERDHLLRNLFHANGGEGLQAFVDKRAPKFQ